MGLIKLQQYAPVISSVTGFNIAIRESKDAQYVVFSISEKAQVLTFGAPFSPGDVLDIALSDEVGKNHLCIITKASMGSEGMAVSFGVKGSCSVKVAPWKQIPKGKLPSKSMKVAATTNARAVIVLPDWARPDVAGKKA